MVVPRHTLVTFAINLALVCACDKSTESSESPELGYADPSSADLAPLPAALADDDLEGNSTRAETLWKLQRAMRVAERVFAANVGVTTTKFIGIARVDPGGGSGEVEFWRWEEESLSDGRADAAEARHWLLVPITFDPDSNLDAQKPTGGPDGEQERIIAAILTARAAMEERQPDARFETYAFRELGSFEGKPVRQTRVYLMGSNDLSPDIEMTVIDAPKRNKPPELAATITHLDAGKLSTLPLTTPLTPPRAPTIMRALAVANATGKPAEIVDGTGTTWHIDQGRLVQGPAPKKKKK